MELKNLQKHIQTLVTLDETNAPVISCYLNLEEGIAAGRTFVKGRAGMLRKSLFGEGLRGFEEALGQIETYLATEILPEARGAALFARGGASPFFLPLQFRVPLPHWLAVAGLPNIYHLVELKDNYHRYVVLLSTEESARIVEVNLGAATEELWTQRPELRKRVGREWTKEHYQSHLRHQTERFIKEIIATLEQLMSAGGHTHLILAGNAQITGQIRRALPKSLAAKLVDTVVASSRDDISEVVAATLSTFIEQEEQESLALVDRLQQEIFTNGLAVVGPEDCLDALLRGQADVLVVAREMPQVTLKEELVRLAERKGCHVEIVNYSETLMAFDGVGCLLRYRLPEQYRLQV